MQLTRCCLKRLHQTIRPTTHSPYFVADSHGNPRKFLTIHDVDIVHNPNKEYIDAFMQGYGKQRLNFKRNDIDIWRECFGYNYDLTFICLKGTKKIIQTSHCINYESLTPETERPHQYQGFLWIDEEYRGRDSMHLLDYCFKGQMRNVTECVMGQCFPQSMNLFIRIFGDDQYSHTTNVSYYKPEEMKVPKELNFDGLTIKSTLDVPDEDIVRYDQSIFPYERSKYMLTHLRDPAGIGKVAYDDNGNVIGFGIVVIYPSGECVLNPLYADNPKIAQAIFKSILEEIPLDDKKLLRFHIRSNDQYDHSYNWFQPFIKGALRRQLMAYNVYTAWPAKLDLRRVYSNLSVTTSAV